MNPKLISKYDFPEVGSGYIEKGNHFTKDNNYHIWWNGCGIGNDKNNSEGFSDYFKAKEFLLNFAKERTLMKQYETKRILGELEMALEKMDGIDCIEHFRITLN